MDKSTILELLGGGLLVGLLILFLDPFMYWMPSFATYIALAFAFLGFGVFAGMVWREKSRDEREEQHAMHASRMAYLAGLAVLLVGAAYQALTDMVDGWVFTAIAVMVLVKLGTRLYAMKRL
jgi:hypothetical protein